jgi:hypothetical protein
MLYWGNWLAYDYVPHIKLRTIGPHMVMYHILDYIGQLANTRSCTPYQIIFWAIGQHMVMYQDQISLYNLEQEGQPEQDHTFRDKPLSDQLSNAK